MTDPAMVGPDPTRRRLHRAPVAGGGDERHDCRAGGGRSWEREMRDVGARVEPTLARPWARHRSPEAVLGWDGGRWRVVPPESPTRAMGDGGSSLVAFFFE